VSAALVSFAAGLGVGILYWAVGVRSPAPPLIALAGLLGIVLGELAVPFLKEHLADVVAVVLRPNR
jgi:XapX domain-containing protein